MNKRAGQKFITRGGVYGTPQFCKKVRTNRTRNEAAKQSRKRNRGKK